MGEKWTDYEISYLKDNFKSRTIIELAEHLSRSTNSIIKKKNKLGLRKTKRYSPIGEGDTFGDWKVVSISHVDKKGNTYYTCKCSCGAIKSVRGADLKSKESSSCGGFKHYDITGSTFGELTVLGFSHKGEGNDRSSYYKCVCSCGYVKTIRRDSLLSNNTNSCGRKEHSDLTGKVFSKWTVKSFSHIDKHGNIYYICKCSCGAVKEVRGKHLLSNMSTSCGCSTEYKGEVRIKKYFENKSDFTYKEQESYKGLLSKDGRSELISDGSVYDKLGNLLFIVEYDGIQHYEYRPHFHKSYYDLEQQIKRDRLKEEYCNEKNINLLRIPYWDYDNIEKILDSYIKNIIKGDAFFE